LHARGAPVVEERVDRGTDRAARVEDVVDEHARHPLEGEVELRIAHDGLRVDRCLAAAHLDVVAVEGDVDRAEAQLLPGELGDQASQALCNRHAARVIAAVSPALRPFRPADLRRQVLLQHLAVSPDGAWAAYGRRTIEKDEYRSRLWRVTLDRGRPEQLTFADANDLLPEFSPDGRAL